MQAKDHIIKTKLLDSPILITHSWIAIENARLSLTNVSRKDKKSGMKNLNYGIVLETLIAIFPCNCIEGA